MFIKTEFKIILIYVLLSFAGLSLIGCANKAIVSYGDAQAVEIVDINFGSTDLQKVASQMTDSLLRAPVVEELTKNGRPIVFVERIKNKTSEHIDVESITDSMSTQLLRSGKFRFVEMSRVESVRKQLTFQNEDALINPSSAIEFGNQVGARYMLYGNLSSIVKSNLNTSDVYYKFSVRLMDLKSGLIEWADEVEIRKTRKKSTFGW